MAPERFNPLAILCIYIILKPSISIAPEGNFMRVYILHIKEKPEQKKRYNPRGFMNP